MRRGGLWPARDPFSPGVIDHLQFGCGARFLSYSTSVQHAPWLAKPGGAGGTGSTASAEENYAIHETCRNLASYFWAGYFRAAVHTNPVRFCRAEHGLE